MLLGEYYHALESLEKAFKVHNRAELFYQQSNCYFHLKEDKKGRESLKIALSLDEDIAEDMQQKYTFIKDQVKKVRAKKK